MERGKVILGRTGKGHVGTRLSQRGSKLTKKGRDGGLGARNHKSLMPWAQTYIERDVLTLVAHYIFFDRLSA